MSNEDHVDEIIDVGRMRKLSEKCTKCVVFHNFEEIPKGHCPASRPFFCHGYSWMIRIIPWDGYSWKIMINPRDEDKESEQTDVSLWLCVILPGNKRSLRVKCTLRVGSGEFELDKKFTDQKWELAGYIPRVDVLDKNRGFLDEHGSLLAFADIQVYPNKPDVWKPRNSLHLDMQRLLESKKGADAVFDINGTEFSAHSVILYQRAPTLAELVEEAENSNIPLPGVDPDMFKAFLHFIYTDEIPPEIDFEAMLELANRFGCSRLKLVAESKIIEKGIDDDNAADLLLLADSNSCAYLRETALDYIIANPALVMESNGWKKVEQSPELISEVMRLCFSKKRPASAISGMSVRKLRKELDKRGLDVDGTQQMLIDRLEQAEASAET